MIVFMNNSRVERWLTGIALLMWVAIGIFLFTDWRFDAQVYFFWLFAITLFWWRLDSRISIGMALAGLITIPILLTFEYEQWAEQMAVWVYFFLVIGVVKQIWEYKVESRKVKR